MTKKLSEIIKYSVIVIIFAFLIRSLVLSWNEIAAKPLSLNIKMLAPAFLIGFVQAAFVALIWQALLKKMGYSIRYRRCFSVYYLSQAAKYLPGGFWALVGRSYLSERDKIPKTVSLSGAVIEAAMSVVSGALIVAVYVWSSGSLPGGYKWLAATVALIGIVLLHPKIFFTVANGILRLLHQEPIELTLSYTSVLGLTFLFALAWVIGGVSNYFFVIAVSPLPWDLIPEIIGIFASAGVLSILAVFAPGGIGVREGILAYLLARLVPVATAVIIALTIRAWIIVFEVLLIFIAWRLSLYKGRTDQAVSD